MVEVIGNEIWIGEVSMTFSQIGTFAACTIVLVGYFIAAQFIARKMYK